MTHAESVARIAHADDALTEGNIIRIDEEMFEVGSAIGGGQCLFDTVRQLSGNRHSILALRELARAGLEDGTTDHLTVLADRLGVQFRVYSAFFEWVPQTYGATGPVLAIGHTGAHFVPLYPGEE